MNKLFLYFCFFLIWSCSGSPEQKKIIQKPEEAGYILKSLISTGSPATTKSVNQQFTPPEALYFVHDELVSSPLGLGPRNLPSDIEKKYGNGFKEEIFYPKNDNKQQALDMEVVMERNENMLRLYNGILVTATIVNDEIDIQKGIKVGITKAQFKQKFSSTLAKQLPDKFHIGNTSRTAYFTFIFIDDVLQGIQYTSIY